MRQLGSIAHPIAFLVATLPAFAQPAPTDLAITEIMSYAATNTINGTRVASLSDFFELTNFGDSPTNISGFKWLDATGTITVADPIPFFGLTIEAKESVIFVELNAQRMSSPQQFYEWWGGGLRPGTRVFFYDGEDRGLNSGSDAVRLWAPDGMLVDAATIGRAERGRTFTYDSETGEFGMSSIEGVDKAFRAATRDDVGSPGITTGPVMAKILAQPRSLTNCAQSQAVFSVRAGGMPRPRLQWYANDIPLAGAAAATLIITNPLEFAGVQFHVEARNREGVDISDKVTLTIDTNAASPTFASIPTDAFVFVGDTVAFTSDACAWPKATFQWRLNGVEIVGATNRFLTVPAVTLQQSNSLYCVEARNMHGTASACAHLYVAGKPALRLTEIFARGAANCAQSDADDWFEITNFEPYPVDLRGYRLANNVTDLKDGTAFSIENSIVVPPNSSAVFVRQTGTNDVISEFFRRWDPEALPPNLPISTFSGFGLNGDRDELFLWTPSEGNPGGYLDHVDYAEFTGGTSKWFDYVAKVSLDSVVGELGAFTSSVCGEIGSPGYVINPPARITSIAVAGSQVRLRWRAVPGHAYCVEAALHPGLWEQVGGVRQAINAIEELVETTPGISQRFYRIKELSQ